MSDFVKLFSICNRPTLPVSRSPQLVYILTEILPGPRLADIRLPLNLVLVLDRSGDMAGERLRMLKQAVNHLLGQLQSNDVISIVTFGQQARVVVPAQEVGAGLQIQKWADGIRGMGKRRLATGLSKGLAQARLFHGADRVTRVIVIIGGAVDDPPQSSIKVANQAGALGIPLVGIGIGSDWDEELLIDLTDRSLQAQPGSRAGLVYYASEPKFLGELFDRVYRSSQVSARNAQLAIRTVRGVLVRQVWQTRPVLRDISHTVVQPDKILIPVGELGADGCNYLVEALLEPRPAGTVRVGLSEMSFQAPGFGEQSENDELVIEFSQNLAVTSRLEGYVMDVVQRAQSLKLQVLALQDAESGNTGLAIQKLRQVVPILMSQGEILLADRMRKEMDYLDQNGHLSSEGRKIIRLAFRER